MRKLRITLATTLTAVLALIMTIWSLPAGAQGENGTTLSASKTANGHLTRTFHWTIDKSVTPAAWDLFRGDSGTSEYTIAVTKDEGTLGAYVTGEITVTNGGAVATQNLSIVDNLTMPPSKVVIASVNVDTSANPILDPGETGIYPYRVDIPAGSVEPGETYKDTVDITITNHSGHLGTPFGPSTSATSALPAVPELINDSINVKDTNGTSWTFDNTGSQYYTETFTCDDEGTNDNTATIVGTGQTSSASVTVNCYALEVTKDASTSLMRTWSWTIGKSADQTALTLALGEQFLVNYTVNVNATPADSNWAVSGNITVNNPAPIPAVINSVSDVVSGAINGTVTCDETLPYELAVGGTLKCTYTAGLPDASDRTNTATATLQNHSYDKDSNVTAAGTIDFSGTAAVSFANPTINKLHECITVSDSYAGGPQGVVCAGEAPKTFTYSRWVGPYATCGAYREDNTASFVANDDTNYTGSASWTVDVNVPCAGGCTLTIGYWKTHAGFTGNNADMVTPLLPIWLGTSGGPKSVQVTTAAQAVTLLSMSGEASNGINKLYAQLLGAKLNIASGADSSAVSATMAAADTFLSTRNAADWSSLSKAEKAQVLKWATALDNYNNGLIGPGHCSE